MPSNWRLSRAAFEEVVADAIDALPEEFAGMLENIAIVVEEEPTEDDLDGEYEGELLGIYRGLPRTVREFGAPELPDTVAIFRQPILRVSSSRDEAVEEIRDTLIHELGHYFGLEDDEMPF